MLPAKGGRPRNNPGGQPENKKNKNNTQHPMKTTTRLTRRLALSACALAAVVQFTGCSTMSNPSVWKAIGEGFSQATHSLTQPAGAPPAAAAPAPAPAPTVAATPAYSPTTYQTRTHTSHTPAPSRSRRSYASTAGQQ